MPTNSLYITIKNQDFRIKLLNIRHDEELLEKVLDDVFSVYESKSLTSLLKSLLHMDSKKRISMK